MSYDTTIKTEPELIIDDTDSAYLNYQTLSASADSCKEIKSEHKDFQIKPHKQFKCDICHKCFDQKAAKNRHHLLVHTLVRPFSCDICNSTFVDKSCVRNHMQQHIQHYCPICNEPFRHAFNIKRHMLVHNGLRPYNCSLCDKTYKHSSHLKRHLKHHEANAEGKSQGSKIRRNSKSQKGDTCIDCK